MIKNHNPLIDKLFAAGVHFGYAPRARHPSQADVIFGVTGGVELIDLEQTAERLEEALAFIRELARERKTILFVSGKPEGRDALKHTAELLGMPYVASRWIGGTLTNFAEIKKRLIRLADLLEKRQKGELAQFTKRERLLIDREIADLQAMFYGIKDMQKLPDALFVIDSRAEATAVAEARKLGIPVVAFLNTDCDRSAVTYPIPGNDASRHAVELVLNEVAKVYDEARAESLPAQPVTP